jgi:transcriptional regulator with XRE-family HTH domain
LAKRGGTSHSAISRIESGHHAATPETLLKLASALDMRLVIGFERGPKTAPEHDLVVFGYTQR